jgi:hypothetical protein
MKFSNTHNETFFLNLIKHDLNQSEWKVILAFIVDHPKEFNVSLKTLEDRTDIAQPNISRALKGLVYQGILSKQNKKYELNESLLSKEYVPTITSSTEMRKEDESTNIEGHGDFAQQSAIKKKKHEENIEGIRKMHKETAAKRKTDWITYYSKVRDREISILVDRSQPNNQCIHVREGLTEEKISRADFEIVEEVCREILGMTHPGSMVAFIESRRSDEFLDKYLAIYDAKKSS